MARVLFVYSIDGHRRFDRRPISAAAMQLGISYISALLRQHGHRTRLVVLESKRGEQDFPLLERSLHDFAPDLLCCNAVATQYPFVARAAAHVRRLHPKLYQLIGGVHASLNPSEPLSAGFDAVCVGEGEYPTLELATQLERGVRPGKIANLWFRTADGVERNAPRDFLQPLDALPFPDRELWDEWLDRTRPPIHTVLLGRGCPFQCTYCCNHALRKLTGGRYVRMRDPDAIADEVRSLAAPPDTDQEMYLEVETLMLNPDWTASLCRKLAALNASRRRPIRYGANIRVTPHADVEAFFQAFARANIRSVNIGLESGSERVRREILSRYYSNDDVLRTVQAARRHGMRVALYNLIGLPGETRRDFLETARMNRRIRPDAARTSIFFPYPGTVLHQRCQEAGLLPANLPPDRERRQAVLELPGFSRRQVQECFDHFDLYVAWENPVVRRACIAATVWLRALDGVARRVRGYWFVRRCLVGLWLRFGHRSPARPPSAAPQHGSAPTANPRATQEVCP